MTANSSNCDADEADILELADAANTQHDDINFETTGNVDEVVNVITTNEENNEDESDSEDVLTINNQNATLETCSVVYVAGYLIHTVLPKKPCEDCAVALLKENREMLENSEALLLNKNYGCSSTITFLKRPADTFVFRNLKWETDLLTSKVKKSKVFYPKTHRKVRILS
ncbi:hypothetical protein QE152_g39583 [Popillia japonica]|uniref:Uncharacterized protein n=1 Tax=Popillia japonica TaxID=7064 RepID=A0AAW1HTH7_POPJA